MRSEAVVAGYTVVDPPTVISTHLNHLIALNASQMFGMDEARKLLDALKEKSPQLVDGLTPKPLSLAAVTAACRALLDEGVPLQDFPRICEAMEDVGAPDVGPDQVIEGGRQPN